VYFDRFDKGEKTMGTKTKTAKKVTIALTGRPPVTVDTKKWPVIAEARELWHDGQYDFQANRKTSRCAKVRRHSDGRAIVYAMYDRTSAWATESNRSLRRGVMLAAADPKKICRAIYDVCSGMRDGDDDDHWRRLAEMCIADLPAEYPL
jgi:hypothetical protein